MRFSIKIAYALFLLATLLQVESASSFAATTGGTTTGNSKSDEANNKKLDPTIKITLYPAAEPRPSLKYQFQSSPLDQQAGNAAVHYLLALSLVNATPHNAAFRETLVKCATLPLDELRKTREENEKEKKSELRWTYASGVKSEIERGNQCESCDFGLPWRGVKFAAARVPSALNMIDIARSLCIIARLQIADGDFDGAFKTLQIVYRYGHNVALDHSGFFWHALGRLIIQLSLAQVETFIQQPGAPNLYWALAVLPRPVNDIHQLYVLDYRLAYVAFPELIALDKKKFSSSEWQQLLDTVITRLSESYDSSKESPSQAERKLKLHRNVEEGYPKAKQYLIANGRNASDVEAMPVAQVVLLYSTQHYDELCDRMRRSVLLPYPESVKEVKQIERQIDEICKSNSEIIPLTQYVPTLTTSILFSVELDRKIAALSILEAIRMYGVSHAGRLPEQLDDITETPIPNDPMRGRPFLYHRIGDKAVLESPAAPSPINMLRYEIEMKLK